MTISINLVLKLQQYCILCWNQRQSVNEEIFIQGTSVIRKTQIVYLCYIDNASVKLPDVKTIQATKIFLYELNIEENKLNQYSGELDYIMNKIFIE